MMRDDDPKLTLDEAEWRAYKRATRFGAVRCKHHCAQGGGDERRCRMSTKPPTGRRAWNHAVIDAVAEQDRLYFAQHPDASRYIRPAVAGELGPPLAGYAGALVIVTQLLPGVRHRQLLRFGPPAHARAK